MSKYIAFEFQCETNSSTHKIQTCVHNLFLKYVTPTCHTVDFMAKFDLFFFFFSVFTKQRARFGEDLNIQYNL